MMMMMLIVQIVAQNGAKSIFVRDYKKNFFGDFNSSISYSNDIPILIKVLVSYGCFDGDILSTKMSSILEDSVLSLEIATSFLCLRFMNIFENGGCTEILP